MEVSPKTASMPLSSKLKVLQVSNHWEMKRKFVFSGIFVDRQIDSLKNAGIDISTFDIGTSHSPFKVMKKWLELRRKVKQVKPDIIHAQYGSIVGLLSVLAGRPTVVSYCGHDLLTGSEASAFRMYLGFLLSNLAALGAVGLICKSEQLRQALWWRRNQAVVIPNGVDLDLFSPGCQEHAREELGWKSHQRIVLINVGSNPIRKGLDLSKRAIQVTQSRVPEAELYEISNVDPHQMVLYYRAADALVCTSKHEGSPNVVKEALARNLPIVSIPVGDVPLRLDGVEPSAVVESNPEAIGNALSEILLCGNRSNGRDHVSALSLDKVAQKIIAVYRDVVPNF